MDTLAGFVPVGEVSAGSIHRRELLVWQDEQVRAALVQGLEQSAGGEVIGAGDFTRFADDEIDDVAAEA